MAHWETCCKCKMQFAMPDSFHSTMLQLSENGSFYCPAGHAQHYISGKSDLQKAQEKADEYRRQAERAIQKAAQLQDEVAIASRSAAAYKGVATRMKNRARAGVCPCCNRTFQNLANHMKSQHPEAELNNVIEFGQAG